MIHELPKLFHHVLPRCVNYVPLNNERISQWMHDAEIARRQ